MSDSIEQIAAVLEGWADQKIPVTPTTAKSIAARLRSLRQVPEGWVLVPLVGTEVKADHPQTCLNPTETFDVIAVEVDSLGARARGDSTCWFGVGLLSEPKATTAQAMAEDATDAYITGILARRGGSDG